MIEAMACGTPVVAFRCGSVPEVVEDGLTGYVVEPDDALNAIHCAARLDRLDVRKRFGSLAMAKDYVRLYENLIENAGVPLAKAS
jgi:glycosyltransferase involved in cell wall biosynthesis